MFNFWARKVDVSIVGVSFLVAFSSRFFESLGTDNEARLGALQTLKSNATHWENIARKCLKEALLVIALWERNDFRTQIRGYKVICEEKNGIVTTKWSNDKRKRFAFDFINIKNRRSRQQNAPSSGTITSSDVYWLFHIELW